MKRVRALLVRAFIGTLLILTLSAGVASADASPSAGAGSGSAPAVLPEDPGIGE